MGMNCTRCDASGFLNLAQIVGKIDAGKLEPDEILTWLNKQNVNEFDTQVCDCCGDGDQAWYGIPGEHYNSEDPGGDNGPYASNGGFCHCH